MQTAVLNIFFMFCFFVDFSFSLLHFSFWKKISLNSMYWCRGRSVSHITPIFLLSATWDLAPTMMQSFIDGYLVLSRLYSCCLNHKGAW